MIYKCNDGNCEVEIEADSAREAAEEYVNGGDWGNDEETFWVSVYCTDEDGFTEKVKIEVEPTEPDCERGKEHDWQAPYEILGGLKENPGVWGNGGGVKYTMVCMNCGCGKHVNTWAQDRNDGEQGFTSVRYEQGEFADEIREKAEVE